MLKDVADQMVEKLEELERKTQSAKTVDDLRPVIDDVLKIIKARFEEERGLV